MRIVKWIELEHDGTVYKKDIDIIENLTDPDAEEAIIYFTVGGNKTDCEIRSELATSLRGKVVQIGKNRIKIA